MTKVVGPGASIQTDTAPSPALEGATEYEYIHILNPLPDDFAVLVAQDVPVNMPYKAKTADGTTIDERELSTIYGANLRNKDFKSTKHISNQVVIKAGQTINMKGDQAQVAVRQLVNEIAQRNGKSRLMSDPTVRKEIEDQIIQGRGSIQDLMDNRIQSPRTQADEAIKQSNEEHNDEEAFPGLNEGTPEPGTGANYTPDSDTVEKRNLGKAKKANS